MKKRKYYFQGLVKLLFCEVEIQSSWELRAKALVKIVNQWVFSQYGVKLKIMLRNSKFSADKSLWIKCR